MTRQLYTSQQYVRRQQKAVAQEKTRRAWLVTPYRDKVAYVTVTFSDPRTVVVGMTVRAKISPGVWGLSTVAPNLDAGYPVTVVVRRGKFEVVGF